MSALAAARRALALFPDATELCGAVHNLASAELCLEEAGANPEPRAAMRMYGMSSAYVSVAEALMGHDEKALRAAAMAHYVHAFARYDNASAAADAHAAELARQREESAL